MIENPVKTLGLFIAGVFLAVMILFSLIFRTPPNKDPLPRKTIKDTLEIPGYTLRDITRAVDDLVYRSSCQNDAIVPALETLISHPDLEIRFVTARYLYRLGSDSGSKAMRKIISLPKPAMVSAPGAPSQTRDLRMDAAFLVAQFRDKRAADAVMDLYENTPSLPLLHCLARLEAKRAGPLVVAALHKQPTWELLEDAGLLKVQGDDTFIAEAMNNQEMSMAIRLAAAWALTQIKDDKAGKQFINDYLSDRRRIRGGELEAAARSVKYLGTLQDWESIDLLEQIAQTGGGGELARPALISLILNHRGNKVGVSALRRYLSEGEGGVPFDAARALAAASQDPEVLKLIDDGSWKGRPETGSWLRDRTGKARWSVWGWADAYLITIPKDW